MHDAATLHGIAAHLAEGIGPRPATSPAERAAAAYVRARLAALEFSADTQTFRTSDHLSKRLMPNLMLITAALGGGLVVGRTPRALLGLLSLGLAWQFRRILRGEPPPWEDALAEGDSQNVILRIPPSSTPRGRLVLTTALDSATSQFAARPFLRAWVPHVLAAAEVTAWSGGILSLLATDDQRDTATHPWRVGTALFALGLGLLSALDTQGPPQSSPQSASGVAALLGLAASLSAQPLRHTEVWLAFTGAGHVAGSGLDAFFTQYGGQLDGARVVVLRDVGAGELAWISEHRLSDTMRYAPPPTLAEWATRVAAEMPTLGVMGRAMNSTDQSAVVRRHGFPALCLRGYERESGHAPHDSPLTEAALHKAATYTRALLDDYEAGLSSNG